MQGSCHLHPRTPQSRPVLCASAAGWPAGPSLGWPSDRQSSPAQQECHTWVTPGRSAQVATPNAATRDCHFSDCGGPLTRPQCDRLSVSIESDIHMQWQKQRCEDAQPACVRSLQPRPQDHALVGSPARLDRAHSVGCANAQNNPT